MLAPTIVPVADASSVSIPRIIQHMKGVITKQIGVPLWQKSFHDHIIRNEDDYRAIWNYIDTNPFLWTEDCFYQP